MAVVTVEKLTGEAFEFIVDLDDQVHALKTQLAERAQIPAMCQRLTLTTDEVQIREIRKRSRAFLVQTFAQSCADFDEYQKDLQALKQWARPPMVVMEIMHALFFLLAGPTLGIHLEEADPNRISDWRRLAPMLRDWPTFLNAVQNWADDVLDGRISHEQVMKAKMAVDSVPMDTLPSYCRFSTRMARWCSRALKFYQQEMQRFSPSGATAELLDLAPLSVYLEEKSRNRMNVMCDLGPVWSALEVFPGTPDELFSGLEALKWIGTKSPEKTLKVLAPYLVMQYYAKSRLLRAAALAAVRSFAPCTEHAERLLAALPEFPGPDPAVQRRGGFPRKEALLAVAHLGSLGHFPSLERIISSLNSGGAEDRWEAFELFVRLEGHCDAEAVIGCLEAALFDPKFREQQQEHPRSQGPLYDSLKLTSQRHDNAARQCLLRHLDVDVAVWQQARAATAARYFVRGDDVEMMEALEACMLRSQKLLAVTCASALISLAVETYSKAMPVICAELEKGLSETDTHDALAQVMDHGREGDEHIIRSLLRFLRKGKRLLRSPDSAKLLRSAWNGLKKVATPQLCRKGTYEVLFALASKLATKPSGDGPGLSAASAFAREFMAMAKMGGVDDRIFRELARGFQLQGESRQLCMKTYQNLASLAEYKVMGVQVLLQEAKDENSLQTSRIAALQVLVDLDAEITEEMVSLLLELAESTDVALRAAALRCLRPWLKSETSISEFLLKQLQDKDSSIRLAALKSMGKQQEFQGAYLLCLQDDASDVVHLALDLLSEFPSRQEEICPHLAPLLRHGDWRVRKTATEQLGRMSGARARSAALGALEAYDPWKETKDDVTKAREHALKHLRSQTLSPEVQKKSPSVQLRDAKLG